MRYGNSTRLAIIAGTTALLTTGSCLAAGDGAHWTYSGKTGPEHWAELSPDYAACGIGVNQSPIDIVNTIDAELDPLVFDYRSGSIDIVNNGHTLQVNAEPGSTLRVRGNVFQLQQLHFHSPSEHRIDGEKFPLEAHLVHRDDQGRFAVVAIVFREGEWNADLEKIGTAGPKTAGQSAPFDIDFRKLRLYRNHAMYYTYSGSLTTPPCTEGIRWYILKTEEPVSSKQAAEFVNLIGQDARGPQPINARVVMER